MAATTPTRQHVNPFAEFQPFTLSTNFDTIDDNHNNHVGVNNNNNNNFLNKFNNELSADFGNLDEFGNNSNTQYFSRVSDQNGASGEINLNNVGNGFLDDTRLGSRLSNPYSYIGDITDESRNIGRNPSILFDSRVAGTNNNNKNNNNNNDSFHNSTLFKQSSFIDSIKNQQNQRVSQENFMNRHLTRQPTTTTNPSSLQRSFDQSINQPTTTVVQQQPPVMPVTTNFQNSLPFDNFNGDEDIKDTSFSFNVSNPNIGDEDFYGSQNNNRFNQDFNGVNGGNFGRQGGSNNFTEINNQSVVDYSLMYSPATNYQGDDDSHDDDRNFNNNNNDNDHDEYQQQPHIENYDNYNDQEVQQQEEEQQQEETQPYYDQYTDENQFVNSNPIIIQSDGEAKTPGTYFQYKSPNMGRLSGRGSHIEFGETIPDDDNNNRGNNEFNQTRSLNGNSIRRSTISNNGGVGGIPGIANGNSIGINTPNNFNNSVNNRFNNSNNSNYVSPINNDSNGNNRTSTRSQNTTQNDTTFASVQIHNDPSHIGYTPERGNLDFETYNRLKERYLNGGNKGTTTTTTTTTTNTNTNKTNKNTTDNQSFSVSAINESQYRQHQQPTQTQPIPPTPQRQAIPQRQQQQQVRPPTPQRQVPPTITQNKQQQIDKYPMVSIDKRIDFEKCELEWVLNRDIIITNPHTKPVTLTNINIIGIDKIAFKLKTPDNSNNNKSIFIIQPLSYIILQIEYLPTADNLPTNEDSNSGLMIHNASLVITLTPTIQSHLDNFNSTEFIIEQFPQGSVFNISIPITGIPTADILNHDDLLYSYNDWNMGECISNNTLISNLSLKSQNGSKLTYQVNGEGFSFEKLPNDSVSLKFSLPEIQIYNAEATVIDPLTGQKKIIKLSATVNNTLLQQQPAAAAATTTVQQPLIIDPSPSQSPVVSSSSSVSTTTTKSKSFTPNFINKKDYYGEDEDGDEEIIRTNSTNVPLKISNYVLENGIKLIYEERKKIYPVETLPIFCNFENQDELIEVECISTQPDVFSISPSIFTIQANSMIPLQIKYQPSKNIQSQRAAFIISTPSITKEKIKIDLIGITLSLDSTLYIPSSPPSPTYQSKRFNNARKDNYNSPPTIQPISSPPTNNEYLINNSSVIFQEDNGSSSGSDFDINSRPSLYCNRKVVNFGGVKLGDTRSIIITLTSTLPQALHLNIAFKQGSGTGSNSSINNNFFSIGNGDQLLISPNSKTEIEVVYTPLSVLPHANVVVFQSLNKQLSFSIPVLGYGGNAKMEVVTSARNLDSQNTILYVNKQSNDGKSVYCKFTVKNTGQRSGFIRAISSYPNSRTSIKPDRVTIGVGEQIDFRLDIHPIDNNNNTINNLLSGNGLLNSTMSPGKVKLFFGDELSRQRKIRSIHGRLENLKTTTNSNEISFDGDFLYDYRFKDEEDQDIQFKELFINQNKIDIDDDQDGANLNHNFDLDDYDDVELFFKQLSSLKITPIIGNPPSSSNGGSNNGSINSGNKDDNDIFKNLPTNNNINTTPISSSNRPFELSEIDLNNTPFRATTANLPIPTNSVLNANTTTTQNLKSILKKTQPLSNNVPIDNNNNLYNTFENTLRFNNPTTTTTGTAKEEVRHYHVHKFQQQQEEEEEQLRQQQNQKQQQYKRNNNILFFNEPKTIFGVIQVGESFTNKVLVSNASTTTLNISLSLDSKSSTSPFTLTHHTLSLKPKSTTRVPIQFIPKEIGTFTTALKVESIPKTNDDPLLFDSCELIGQCKPITF